MVLSEMRKWGMGLDDKRRPSARSGFPIIPNGAPISSSERAGVSVIQQYTTHKWSLSKMTDMVLTDVDR